MSACFGAIVRTKVGSAIAVEWCGPLESASNATVSMDAREDAAKLTARGIPTSFLTTYTYPERECL